MDKVNNKKNKHDNSSSQTLPIVAINPNQQCEVVNINGQLVAFCQTTDFKTYVRKAVNDELFWRDILNTYSISSMVQNELNNKLPTQVKSETLLVVNKMVSEQNTKVSDQLESYTRIQIPSHVSKALQDQMTGFLNNHVQMNQILAQHSENLKQNFMQYSASLDQNLRDSAARALSEVTNDPQHYALAQQHITIQNQKFEIALVNQNKQFNDNLIAHNGQINEYVKKVNEHVNRELQTVTEANKKVEEQTKVIEKQNKKIDKLEQHIGSLQMYFGIFAVVSGMAFTGIGYLMRR